MRSSRATCHQQLPRALGTANLEQGIIQAETNVLLWQSSVCAVESNDSMNTPELGATHQLSLTPSRRTARPQPPTSLLQGMTVCRCNNRPSTSCPLSMHFLLILMRFWVTPTVSFAEARNPSQEWAPPRGRGGGGGGGGGAPRSPEGGTLQRDCHDMNSRRSAVKGKHDLQKTPGF